MNDHPVEANGMGGCTSRYSGGDRGTGQIFDHHFVEFTYRNGVKLYSQCRHIPNTWEHVAEYAYGSEGHSGIPGNIQSKGPSKRKARRGGFGDYVQEHHDLIAAIKNNEKYNEGWYGATSSMTAVLGRMATYSGKIVKWDDLVAKGGGEFPKQLAWDAPAPVKQDADGNYPIPVPGIFQA